VMQLLHDDLAILQERVVHTNKLVTRGFWSQLSTGKVVHKLFFTRGWIIGYLLWSLWVHYILKFIILPYLTIKHRFI